MSGHHSPGEGVASENWSEKVSLVVLERVADEDSYGLAESSA